jgi:hypothetical protein
MPRRQYTFLALCFRLTAATIVLALVLTILTSSSTSGSRPALLAAARATETVTEEDDSDAFVALNNDFRKAYANARKDLLAHEGPIILVESDDLVLVQSGKRTVVTVVPALYHTLKTVSHVPLGIYVLLHPATDWNETIDHELLAELRRFQELLEKARLSLGERGLNESTRKRQLEILGSSLRFLDRVIHDGRAPVSGTNEFVRSMGPLLLENAAECARAQIDSMHRQVMAWKKGMPPGEWQRLRVVVMGSALPRMGNLSVQYFRKLLREKGESERIVYAESLFDESRALNLLGTNLLDSDIGAAFFGDPARMHRDLLADAAEEYLKKLDLSAN